MTAIVPTTRVAFSEPTTFTPVMDHVPNLHAENAPIRRSGAGRADIDAAALSAAAAGGSAAMRSIYNSLAPTVAGYARGHGADDPEAIANETLYRVLDGLSRFEGDVDRFRSWAFTIAHNLIVDDRRRLARRPRSAATVEDIHLPAVASAEATAVSAVETQQMIDWIRQLPPGQRDVLLLRLVADLSVKDVSRIVGKRDGAVKALHRRGLDALRSQLAGSTVSEFTPTTFTEV